MPARPPRPPVERIRDRLAREIGDRAQDLPRGYQRLGDVVLLRLPASLEVHGTRIGELFQEELRVRAVLALEGAYEGELRHPRTRRLVGECTETVHQEEGIRWHLDPSEVMFAAGNRWERRRAGTLVRPGERVADLFAGIGYFTVPAAKYGRPECVEAVEKNPRAYAFLLRNLEENHVRDRVRAHLGDNREVVLPPASFDRVFLGLLPSAIPFVPRALGLLAPQGGWLHVHLVVSAPRALEEAVGRVSGAIRAEGGSLLSEPIPRVVKPYGPSRSHLVVDARARPSAS